MFKSLTHMHMNTCQWTNKPTILFEWKVSHFTMNIISQPQKTTWYKHMPKNRYNTFFVPADWWTSSEKRRHHIQMKQWEGEETCSGWSVMWGLVLIATHRAKLAYEKTSQITSPGAHICIDIWGNTRQPFANECLVSCKENTKSLCKVWESNGCDCD